MIRLQAPQAIINSLPDILRLVTEDPFLTVELDPEFCRQEDLFVNLSAKLIQLLFLLT